MLSTEIEDRAYFCGWTIIGRAAFSHLIASRDFPAAGSWRRAWCGRTVMIIGLTLNAREARPCCPECNQRLRQLANHEPPAQSSSGTSPTMTPLPEGHAT